MRVQYRPATEVEEVARTLIRDYHRSLTNVRIEYLFTNRTPVKSGRDVWASVRRIGSLPAYLAGETDPDGSGALFCMVVAEQIWSALPHLKRVALIDHELCHCFVDQDEEGNEKPILLGHDLEEFVAVVARHGQWRNEVATFLQAAERAEPGLLDERDEQDEAA